MNKIQELSAQLLEIQSEFVFFSLDLDYKYLHFSQKHYEVMKNIWGFEINVGISILDIITSEEDRIKAKNNIDRVIFEKQSFVIEEQFGDEFLSRSYYKDTYFPLLENDKVVGVLVTVEEVQHIQEKQIFEQIVSLTKSGITLSDCTKEDNPLIFVNDAFVEITGYNKSETLGRNCRFLQNDDRNQEARFIIREAIDQGKSCEVELRNYKKDGTLFYNLLSLSPIFDTNGKLLYYVGIQNDITRLKQQSELYFQKKRGESLTQLIKNISHQWRQPLSLISILSGAIQLKIEAGILSNDELIENTTKIVETTQYLSNILSDFDSFLANDNKSNFKLKDLFIESIIMIPKINFVIGFDDNFEISSYKHILGQCIISLISNCENALEDKSEKYIFIDAIKTQTHTTITLKDNGGGISEDILENVFDPYFTTKHQSQGTGLGLYLIQVFLQNINGNIFIKNINFKYNEQNYKGIVATIILENQ